MASNKDVQSRRQSLVAKRDECFAKMTPAGRRAYDQPQQLRAESTANKGGRDSDLETDNSLLTAINDLISDADRLRQGAENDRDVGAALRAMDTHLKALLLRGKATGELATARRPPRTSVHVPSREEGVQIAGELILTLATEGEISDLLAKLENRRLELTTTTAPNSRSELHGDPVQMQMAGREEMAPGSVLDDTCFNLNIEEGNTNSDIE
jgi:hypothetical protein